jgi:hypothetical protein
VTSFIRLIDNECPDSDLHTTKFRSAATGASLILQEKLHVTVMSRGSAAVRSVFSFGWESGPAG